MSKICYGLMMIASNGVGCSAFHLKFDYSPHDLHATLQKTREYIFKELVRHYITLFLSICHANKWAFLVFSLNEFGLYTYHKCLFLSILKRSDSTHTHTQYNRFIYTYKSTTFDFVYIKWQTCTLIFVTTTTTRSNSPFYA